MKKIRMIAILLISMVVFSAKSSIAQESTFKLSDYKNPDYFYQSLDMNFGLNSGFGISKGTSTYDASTHDFSLSSGAGAVYSLYKNSPKTQSEFQASVNANIGSTSWQRYYSSPEYERTTNTFNQAENVYISGLKRFYNPKQNYFEINGLTSSNYNGRNDKQKQKDSGVVSLQTENEEKRFDLKLALALLIGKGRIEQVQDARLAMYILEDLKKLNRENRLASNEDVLAMARLITSLKYKRFFDSRLRNIAEISAIDSFLQKNNISGTADAAYFTSINDNWNYANNPVRNSGKRIFTGLESDYSFNYYSLLENYIVPAAPSSNPEYKRQTLGLFLVAGAAYEKPTSLKWQNSANLKIAAGFRQSWDKNNPFFYTALLPSLKLTADYGFGYYPNSRTWLTLKWWLSSGWDNEKRGTSINDKQDSGNNFFAYTGPQLQAYYYLSEKLRLSFTFNGQFSVKYDKHIFIGQDENSVEYTEKYWNQQINANLTYSLF